MATGVPVLATAEAVAGLQVKHGRECLVCERAGDFALAMRALADPGFAAQLGRHARRYVQDNFSLDVLRRRWSGVVAELAR